jgi:hypothetical protein
MSRRCDESHARNQHNVAIARAGPAVATFLPYSQHFVAIHDGAPTIATKYCLPRRPTQPWLTFAGIALDIKLDSER